MSDLQKKLAEVKAKREAKEAERAAKSEETALLKAIEHEERELANLDTLEKLEEKYGADKIARMDTQDGRMVVVKAATRAQLHQLANSKSKPMEDIERIVAQCRVHPSAEEWDKIREDYPGMMLPLHKAISKLSGADQEVVEKK